MTSGMDVSKRWLALYVLCFGVLMIVLDTDFTRDVLPGMLVLGLGAGMALNPVLLAAMNDVSASESGLASGVVNTSFMMGGALRRMMDPRSKRSIRLEVAVN